MIACSFGHKDIVQLLLNHSVDRNIDLNARNESGGTAFMIASMNGQKYITQLLLALSRIDVNARDNDGSTAYMRACYYGHTDIVKLFLEYSKDRSIDLLTQ